MLDLKDLRNNTDFYKTNLAQRNELYITEIDNLLKIDIEKRAVQTQSEELQAQRNSLSKSIKSPEQAAEIKPQVAEINAKLQELEAELQAKTQEINNILHTLPNISQESVPAGTSEEENIEIKRWGIPANITSPEEHSDIATRLNLFDQELTSTICGSRFSTFWGVGARLQRAIINFFIDEAINNNYLEVSPPAIVNDKALFGTGQLPKFEEDLYLLEGTSQYLIPTAEVPLTGLYASSKSLVASDFPKRFAAYTPCFRKEAGSAGRDTRGIIRQHQFDKVELVHICAPEDSESEHERLAQHVCNLLEKLELPYRQMILCTGDMGFSASKCYDFEVWFPSQNNYREISSCSNCFDFQARRMNFRFKREAKGKPEYVHTLNGSGMAVGRTWAAILENNIQPDGSVNIPKALQPYMNNLTSIS